MARRIGVIALSAAPFVLPVMYFVIRDRMLGLGRAIPGDGGAAGLSSDLLSFISPSVSNPLIGWLSPRNKMSLGPVNYLGIAALVMAFGGIWWAGRNRNYRYFWAVFGVFTLLALGPELHAFGASYDVPMPFNVFKHVPLLDNMRAPARFGVMSVMALAVLVPYAMKGFLAGRRMIYFLLSAVIFMEFITVPMPMFESRVPAAYDVISADSAAEAVFEVPFYLRDGFGYFGGPVRDEVQFFQAGHHKKILNGFVARFDRDTLIFDFIGLPLVRLIYMQELGFDVSTFVDFDRAMGGEVANLLGLDYVVIHKRLVQPSLCALTESLLELKAVAEDENTVVYRVMQQQPSIETASGLDVGQAASIPYLMKGWTNFQSEGARSFAWASGDGAEMLVNLPPQGRVRAVLTASPHPELVNAEVKVSLRGAYRSFHAQARLAGRHARPERQIQAARPEQACLCPLRGGGSRQYPGARVQGRPQPLPCV